MKPKPNPIPASIKQMRFRITNLNSANVAFLKNYGNGAYEHVKNIGKCLSIYLVVISYYSLKQAIFYAYKLQA